MQRSCVRVLLVGAKGRMGRTIIDLVKTEPNIEIVAQCDLGDAIAPAMKDSDVLIDFSQAEAIDEICRAATKYRQPIVIGTTGHSPAQRELIEKTAQSVPIVFASNFSVGVNALFALARQAGEILCGFDVAIVEAHHKSKKDAPSGTAKTLAEILKRARRSQRDVPIESIREGEITGEHSVVFTGEGERLELIHRTASRGIFARGALRAGQWIIGKPAGLYSMQNVLGL
ncbi:MAG TPA: 4-hydroxy-tetrahydrodipicolinate reductase [Chthoniobacterales bacterium]|nr:4-hydroxy-tetrahydrodipicolinate reductase [Chthoniobacterales bacterium]